MQKAGFLTTRLKYTWSGHCQVLLLIIECLAKCGIKHGWNQNAVFWHFVSDNLVNKWTFYKNMAVADFVIHGSLTFAMSLRKFWKGKDLHQVFNISLWTFGMYMNGKSFLMPLMKASENKHVLQFWEFQLQYESRHEKTGLLHMRKQRRRSAVR